jgi:WD40 repeat protein
MASIKQIIFSMAMIVGLLWIPNASAAPIAGSTISFDRGTFQNNQADGTTISAENAENLVPVITLEGHQDEVMALAFSPDGSQLASASLDGTIRLWSLPGGELERELTGHEAGVLTLDYSGDGETLVSGGYDRTARLWDVASGELIETVDTISRGYILAVDFAPEGPLFVMADNLCSTEVRRAPSGLLDQTLQQST